MTIYIYITVFNIIFVLSAYSYIQYIFFSGILMLQTQPAGLIFHFILFSKLNIIVSSLFYLSNEQGETSSFNNCCYLTSSRANVLIHYVAIIHIDYRSRSLHVHINTRVIKLISTNTSCLSCKACLCIPIPLIAAW